MEGRFGGDREGQLAARGNQDSSFLVPGKTPRNMIAQFELCAFSIRRGAIDQCAAGIGHARPDVIVHEQVKGTVQVGFATDGLQEGLEVRGGFRPIKIVAGIAGRKRSSETRFAQGDF